MISSPSNARFSWQKVAEQGQLQFLAERRERLEWDISGGCRQRIPHARRSHRKREVAEGGSTYVSTARPMSTSLQTGDGDVKPHQPSDEASQQGTEAQCHVGNDASEHTAETRFSPVLLASVVHGEVELCVLTSSLRRQVERQRSTPKTEPNGYNGVSVLPLLAFS